ncbi:MAG: phosphatidylglycerophosphatase A family protein [Planctomycetota bacterium]|jgi:phosphatidylglycerophosphatase A
MKKLLATCFGLGLLPGAPGTFGSVPPVVIYMVLRYLDTPPVAIFALMVIFIITGSLVCILCAPAIIKASQKTDPQEIVADEFAGQAVTFIPISLLAPADICVSAALCFLLFRLFDITKPWPIKKLEKLPQGWGILADDLLAGAYSAVLAVIFLKLYSFYLT